MFLIRLGIGVPPTSIIKLSETTMFCIRILPNSNLSKFFTLKFYLQIVRQNILNAKNAKICFLVRELCHFLLIAPYLIYFSNLAE